MVQACHASDAHKRIRTILNISGFTAYANHSSLLLLLPVNGRCLNTADNRMGPNYNKDLGQGHEGVFVVGRVEIRYFP